VAILGFRTGGVIGQWAIARADRPLPPPLHDRRDRWRNCSSPPSSPTSRPPPTASASTSCAGHARLLDERPL